MFPLAGDILSTVPVPVGKRGTNEELPENALEDSENIPLVDTNGVQLVDTEG